MSGIIYSTDSNEHLVNIGEKQEEQWCELTEEEAKQDLYDSFYEEVPESTQHKRVSDVLRRMFN